MSLLSRLGAAFSRRLLRRVRFAATPGRSARRRRPHLRPAAPRAARPPGVEVVAAAARPGAEAAVRPLRGAAAAAAAARPGAAAAVRPPPVAARRVAARPRGAAAAVPPARRPQAAVRPEAVRPARRPRAAAARRQAEVRPEVPPARQAAVRPAAQPAAQPVLRSVPGPPAFDDAAGDGWARASRPCRLPAPAGPAPRRCSARSPASAGALRPPAPWASTAPPRAARRAAASRAVPGAARSA